MSYLAILTTFFGFAGALGELIHQARARPESGYPLGVLAFGSLVFLPFCLSLPLDPWLRYPAWLAAAGLILTYSLRPGQLPAWLWSPGFAYRYLGGVMLLILIWSLGAVPALPFAPLSPFAALAAGMALQRSRQLPA